MLNLNIARLNLNTENAAGQEHRVRPVTAHSGHPGEMPWQALI